MGLQRRLSTTQAILSDLDRWNRRQIATIPAPHRVVVSEHLAFGFFTNRYGMKQVAMIDDYATGGQLRPSSLRNMQLQFEGVEHKSVVCRATASR